MLERLDHAARRVLRSAQSAAAGLGDQAVGTEHLLLALASADRTTARLLAEAGTSVADLRRIMVDRREPRPRRDPDFQTLLATLGIDAEEVRRRTEETFGGDAVADAVSRVRPRKVRRPVWTWISCSKPLPLPTNYSPLTGSHPEPIPRVRRLVKRAVRAARPQLAAPPHLLLALINGNEPASEVLTEYGVNLDEIARTTRRQLETNQSAQGDAGQPES